MNTLLYAFLKTQNIFINREELELQISTHPSYPSLHAVTGVLNHFDISNLALEVDKSEEVLNQLPNSFFTLVKMDKGDEYCFVLKKGNDLEIHPEGSKKTMSISSFLNIWSGIVVVVEKDDNHSIMAEQSFSKTFWKIGAGTLALIGLVFFLTHTQNIFEPFHFILSIVGVIISVLLIQQEFGLSNTTTEKFCSMSTKTSCQGVIESSGATIYKSFKLTDASMIYFLGCTIAWLLLASFGSTYTLFIPITIMGIPVIVYSLYYQKRIVKQWCPLCLGIVGILILQNISIISTPLFIDWSWKSILILVIGFLSASTIWMSIKPLIKHQNAYKKLLVNHLKFKRNFNLFNMALNQNPAIPFQKFEKELVLGQPEAKVRLLIVTNPLCSFCKSAHQDLDRLLDKYPENISLTIRFNINNQDTESISYQIVSRLFQLYHTKNMNDFRNALSHAYANDVKFDKWLSVWGKASLNYNMVLNKQRDWCNTHNINFTPALYLNEKLYPTEYDRSDISLFMEDLIEEESARASFMEVS